MLTANDLIDYSDFTEAEIEIIAEYEDEPVTFSVAHAQMLLTQCADIETIKDYLQNALTNAKSKGHRQHIDELKKIVEKYEKAHPSCHPGH
ncbi:MAG: hypothetical protein JSR17_00780 [Proteobacteria bacterium]|nr:hypothetical protein [Pseudomonadota bacterium]